MYEATKIGILYASFVVFKVYNTFVKVKIIFCKLLLLYNRFLFSSKIDLFFNQIFFKCQVATNGFENYQKLAFE